MAQRLLHIGSASLCALLLSWHGRTEYATAQEFFLPAAPRRIEIGLYKQDHHRTFRYPDGQEADGKFDRFAIYMRARVTRDVAVEANGGTWHIGATPQFPARDYVQYSVGAGVTASPIRVAGVQLGASVNYWRFAAIDQSPSRYDKVHHQWNMAVAGGRTLHLGRQTVAVWLGPEYVVDWLDQYPPAAASTHARSVHNLGGMIAGSITFAERLRFTGRVSFLTALQTQFGGGFLL